MHRTTRAIVATASIAAALVTGTAVALASGAGSETETPITGTALERASAAALQGTGAGHVTDTEVGDEESLYEVEVTLPDGSQIDVQLDERSQVVGAKHDGTSGDGQ